MNAEKYAKLIEKALLSCPYIENRPRFPSEIEIPELDPDALYWRDEIDIQQNLCLTVMESTFFYDDEIVERAFSYDLREKGTSRLIWRIDNHSRRQPISSRCHVHNLPNDPPNSRIEYFKNSSGTIFTYAIRCINNHFEGKPQDWEEPRQ